MSIRQLEVIAGQLFFGDNAATGVFGEDMMYIKNFNL